MGEGAGGARSRFAAIALLGACAACLGGGRSEAQESGPWTGSDGITETVSQIMSRPEQIGAGTSGGDPDYRGGRLPQSLVQNPNAIPSSDPPKVSGPQSPQTIGSTNFLGAQLSEAGFVPPDSMGDVGPSQILVCVNGRIKLFDKSGAPAPSINPLSTTTDNFFSSVRNNKGTSDPRVRYDRLSQRWFVVMINVAKTNNRIMIAVSSGPTITDTTSFTFFQFQQAAVSPAGNSMLFADYPSLGIDANALYIGCNMFGSFFDSTDAFVVRKSSILGAGPIVATAFRSLGTASSSGPFAPQGVDNDDPASTDGYFIGPDTISSNSSLILRRITDPGGTPTISANITVGNVAAMANPMGGVPAMGSTNPLDDLDKRIYNARIKTYVDGGTTRTTLWVAHTLEVDSSGVASSSGGRDGSRWYEIDNLSTLPTVRQYGTLFDSTASNPDSYWVPSVGVSGQGHMALGCSVAGTNRHAEVAVAGRLRGDALNTLQAPTTAQASATSYNAQNANPQRWGFAFCAL